MKKNKGQIAVVWVFLIFLSGLMIFFLKERVVFGGCYECSQGIDCLPGTADCGAGKTCSRFCGGTAIGWYTCCWQDIAPTDKPGAPTPTKAPPPGGVTVRPTTPPGTTPTPEPTNQCTVDCNKLVCGEDPQSTCSKDSDCAGGYTCNLTTKHCQRCTNPGIACCGYCVPQGWGCSGSPCVYKKECRSYNTNNQICCGPDEVACSQSDPCFERCNDGNPYSWGRCTTCYPVCPEQPTPTATPTPPCQPYNLTCSVSGCGTKNISLNWKVQNPSGNVVLKRNPPTDWADVVSKTATSDMSHTDAPIDWGSYNYIAVCGNYGSEQAGCVIEPCPTNTPMPTATPKLIIYAKDPAGNPVNVAAMSFTYQCPSYNLCFYTPVPYGNTLETTGYGNTQGGGGVYLYENQRIKGVTPNPNGPGSTNQRSNNCQGGSYWFNCLTWDNYWWDSFINTGTASLNFVIVTTTPTPILPPPPTLISPKDVCLSSMTGTYSWSSVPGASTYQIQVFNNQTNQWCKNVGGLTSNSYDLPSCDNQISSGVINWQVEATMPDGRKTGWGVANYSYDNEPPATPVVQSRKTSCSSIDFNWSYTQEPKDSNNCLQGPIYHVQGWHTNSSVSDNWFINRWIKPEDVGTEATTNGTSYKILAINKIQITNPVVNRVYYLQVKAADHNGDYNPINQSPFSSLVSEKIEDNSPPAVPLFEEFRVTSDGKIYVKWPSVVDQGCAGLPEYPYLVQYELLEDQEGRFDCEGPEPCIDSDMSGDQEWRNLWGKNLSRTSGKSVSAGKCAYVRIRSRDAVGNQSDWSPLFYVCASSLTCLNPVISPESPQKRETEIKFSFSANENDVDSCSLFIDNIQKVVDHSPSSCELWWRPLTTGETNGWHSFETKLLRIGGSINNPSDTAICQQGNYCLDSLPPSTPSIPPNSPSCYYDPEPIDPYGYRLQEKYRLKFDWDPLTSDNGCAGLHEYPYRAQYSTSSDFSTVETDMSGDNTWQDLWGKNTSRTSKTFYPETKLYVRVKSRDAIDNQSSWSTVKSITLNWQTCGGPSPTLEPSPTPPRVPSPPTASCELDSYNETAGTYPITWYFEDEAGLQVKDETGKWWFNNWSNSPRTITADPTGIPAFPPGVKIYGKTTYDFTYFSPSIVITCPPPTSTPSPTPTPAFEGTYILGRIWHDENEDYRRLDNEKLLTTNNRFVDVRIEYSCGGYSGVATGNAVNVCEHQYGYMNPGTGPYNSPWIPPNEAKNCSITATINTPGWYFTQDKTRGYGGWRVWGGTSCLPIGSGEDCACTFWWDPSGSLYPGSCQQFDADGKCTKVFVPNIDASTQFGNIWFGVNGKKKPWLKIKNSSFSSNKDITSEIPSTVNAYDGDDTTETFFITGSEPGLATAASLSLGNGSTSSRNWKKTAYLSSIKNKPETFLNFAKNRKKVNQISDLNQVFESGLYLWEGDLVIDNSALSGAASNSFVLIINGNLTINEEKFNIDSDCVGLNSSKNIVLISTGSIELADNTQCLAGVFIANDFNTGQNSNLGLKVKGNLVVYNNFNNGREFGDNLKPAIFIVFEPKFYLNNLQNLSISFYDWRELAP